MKNITTLIGLLAFSFASQAQAKECFKAINTNRVEVAKLSDDNVLIKKSGVQSAQLILEDVRSNQYLTGNAKLSLITSEPGAETVSVLMFRFKGEQEFGVECDGGRVSITKVGKDYLMLTTDYLRGEYVGGQSCSGDGVTPILSMNESLFEETSCN